MQAVSGTVSSFSNDESRLVNELVDAYQWNPTKSVRPLVNSSDIMTVSFGVALLQLVDYDDDTGISTLHVWEIQVSSTLMLIISIYVAKSILIIFYFQHECVKLLLLHLK